MEGLVAVIHPVAVGVAIQRIHAQSIGIVDAHLVFSQRAEPVPIRIAIRRFGRRKTIRAHAIVQRRNRVQPVLPGPIIGDPIVIGIRKAVGGFDRQGYRSVNQRQRDRFGVDIGEHPVDGSLPAQDDKIRIVGHGAEGDIGRTGIPEFVVGL